MYYRDKKKFGAFLVLLTFLLLSALVYLQSYFCYLQARLRVHTKTYALNSHYLTFSLIRILCKNGWLHFWDLVNNWKKYYLSCHFGLLYKIVGQFMLYLKTAVSLCTLDIESLQNRLLKVCYLPATSASLSRLIFWCGH